LRTRAIPERLRGVFTTRRYTHPRFTLSKKLLNVIDTDGNQLAQEGNDNVFLAIVFVHTDILMCVPCTV